MSVTKHTEQFGIRHVFDPKSPHGTIGVRIEKDDAALELSLEEAVKLVTR